MLAALGWREVEVARRQAASGGASREKARRPRKADAPGTAAQSRIRLSPALPRYAHDERNASATNGCFTPASIAPGRWPRPPPRPDGCA